MKITTTRAQLSLAALMIGVSATALAQGTPAAPPAGTSTPATAPGNPGSAAVGSGNAIPSAKDDEIVVTGIRASLANSQAIKRNADTIVDALTAEDIGALPDRSVTESLQRIAGVSISHFAAVNDPDHISPEGQNVVIRGLPFVLSQFNGREAFTANRGRAISFQDVPPELLSTIEVFKNQTADLIEGGIAGTVNLITRRPLDTNKNIFAVTFDYNYGDLAKKESPDATVVASHQWETGAGRFGILASATYSQLFTRQDSTKVTSYRPRCNAGPGCTAGIGAPIAGLTPGTTYYIPTGGGQSRQDFDRRRQGFSAAAQWESPSHDLLATAQFLRTDASQTWSEHTLAVVEDTQQGQVVPVAGSTLTFDNNNILRTGTLTGFNYSPPGSGVPTSGIQQQEISRGVAERATTNDYSAHLAWKASDRLKFDFDGQYTDSTSNDLDVGLYGSTWANEQLDLTGEFPRTTLTAPPGARYTSLSDPASTFWRAAIDHEDNNKGREYAFRADGEFDFAPDSFLKKIKFGARYADRNQTIKSDGYNWGNLSEAWNGSGPVYASTITPSGFGAYNFGNFLRGNPGSNATIFGFVPNNAQSYATFIQGARAIQAVTVKQGGFQGWNPLGQRGPTCGATVTNGCILTAAQGGDGFHTLGEISTNSEKTAGGYVRLDFGSQHLNMLGGIGIDGNIGVRYVHTSTSATGSTQFPTPAAFGNVNCAKPPTSPPVYNICENTPTDRANLIAFANGAYLLNSVGQSYDDWLPSVNLRVIVGPKVQFRFAYSKAITRPSFSDLRDFANLTVYGPATNTVNNPVIGFRADAAGNPLLRPTKSDNFDLSAEYYFSRVGFIAVTGFYKRLTNVYAVSNGVGDALNIGNGSPIGGNSLVNYTNNGVTLPVRFFGVSNNNNVTNVKGVEFSGQQLLSFLPSPFDGIGVEGTYTYIDADKLQGQSNVFGLNALMFPGISKHNFNAAIFYEKYGIQARAAYTWRSHYLIVSQDVNFPSDPVYSGDVGSLDASLFVGVGPHFKIGVEGTNLTNTTSKTYVQINAAGLEAIRGAFQTDRTYRISGRIVF